MPNLLQPYKAFVKKHPSLVQNGERLLHWLVWNPERFSGSEYAYESFNAAVGLLGIYNEAILSEHPGQRQDVANWAFWLAAVEQIQTLIELRAIHLEERGKMSRYGPLMALEVLKCALRMALWRSSKCTLAMEEVTREDQEQHECQEQLKELLEALSRLRQRHDYDPATAPTPEHMQYNAHLAHASAVRAAAVAPCRPPAACAAAAAAAAATSAAVPFSVCASPQQCEPQQQQGPAAGGQGAAVRCAACGSVQGPTTTSTSTTSGSSSCSRSFLEDGEQQQQQEKELCRVCGRHLHDQSMPRIGSSSSSSTSSQPLPGLSEITPVDAQQAGKVDQGCSSSGTAGSSSDGSSSSKPLRQGWWQRMTSAVTGVPQQPEHHHQQHQHQPQQQLGGGGAGAGMAGALPGSWGPGLRPYPALSPSSSMADQTWQQQHQRRPPWSVSHRDASIGRSVMWAGEFVHVIRPLVYVAMLRRYGLNSWKPWMTMLALDAASGYGLHTGHAILVRSNAGKWPAGSTTLFSLALLRSLSSGQWSPGEQQELMARRMQLLRYLLRSPCYNAFTRHLLLKVVSGSRWVPGLSSLTEFAFSMIEGMQSYYTYVEC